MDPAHVLIPAPWLSFDMHPYPSPAPSDFHHPASGPARRRHQSDAYALTPYAPYVPQRHRSRPRSISALDPPRGPSPSVSALSDDDRSRHAAQQDPPSPLAHSSATSASASTHAPRLPPPPPRRDPPKHTKHRLRDSDRKAICQFHIDHPQMRQEDIGTQFNVERSTISKILKEKTRWLNISPEDESNEQTSRHRPSKFPEIEWEMRKTLQVWSENGVNITDNLIRNRALEIARENRIGTDRFKGSSGWVENFKARHDIRRGEWGNAERFGPMSRGGPAPRLVPPPGSRSQQSQDQGMGMGMDYGHAQAQSHHQQHQQHQHHQHQQWPGAGGSPDSRSSDSSPGSGPSASHNLVLDPALDSQSQLQQHSASPDMQHASGSGGGGGGAHTPVQTQLALDASAIQHSPESYDAQYVHGQPLPSHHHHLMNQPLVENVGVQQQTVYGRDTDGAYVPLAMVGEHPPPSLQEAEDAMTLVIRYVDNCAPEGLLTANEREALTNVKCALFQHASGMPYVRP